MATPKKADTVKGLSEKLEKAKAVIVTDYQGIKHKDLENLRKLVKKADAEFTVTKNTLLKRALTEGGKNISDTILRDATAALFAYGDEATPVKALADFFKAQDKGKIKGGLLGSEEMDEAGAKRLADLPPRLALLAQLVGQMKAPISGLHNALSWNMKKLVWTLDSIKTKKSN